jgi:hypothetical protein
VKTPEGEQSIDADLVVGADGRHSTVARLTGVEAYGEVDMTRGGYFGYWPMHPAWRQDPRYDFDMLFAYEGDADGLEIPREVQDYRLGSLIGVISDSPMPGANAKPFTIGKSSELTAPEGGKLFLKMHAKDNEACRGTMDVEISGNFKDPVVRANRR